MRVVSSLSSFYLIRNMFSLALALSIIGVGAIFMFDITDFFRKRKNFFCSHDTLLTAWRIVTGFVDCWGRKIQALFKDFQGDIL